MKYIYNSSGHELRLPEIVNSKGIYLYDNSGNKYMDLESGVWCTSLGHNHSEVNRAMEKQINSVMHAGFCYSNMIVNKAAEKVLNIAGMEDGQAVFLCSGSEAIELGRQITKHLTGKTVSMTLQDSYLGSYSSVVDRNNGWFLFDWSECRNCNDKENCRYDCKKLSDIPDVSEFVFEPGSASGFVRFPPPSLIKNIVKTVRNNGGKVIVNEVTTGIGRTGKWFGFHHYGFQPDIVAMGKGLGNGFPVSMAALSSEVIEELNRNDFHYSQSHQNDPLGAVVAKTVIEIIENDGLLEKCRLNGEVFFKQLQELVDGETVMEVRGRGMMFGMDLASVEIGNIIYEQLLRKGFIICNRKGLFRIDPPLITKPEELTRFINTFKQIQAEVKRER